MMTAPLIDRATAWAAASTAGVFWPYATKVSEMGPVGVALPMPAMWKPSAESAFAVSAAWL